MDMLQGNVSSTVHFGLLMYMQKNIHINGTHKYPGITFEGIKVHMFKAGVPFTVISIYKAPKMTVKELKNN